MSTDQQTESVLVTSEKEDICGAFTAEVEFEKRPGESENFLWAETKRAIGLSALKKITAGIIFVVGVVLAVLTTQINKSGFLKNQEQASCYLAVLCK